MRGCGARWTGEPALVTAAERQAAELGIELVPIGPGTFEMGSHTGEAAERPVHAVTISRGFRLGKHPVTQAEYAAVMGFNPSFFRGARNPVETVSWESAAAFCLRLSDLERAAGALPSGLEYRLPTEAEWEYACRAGTSGDCAGRLADMAWYAQAKVKRPRRVGSLTPNAWGLHDMHGNVWEWCWDWYDGRYYARSPHTDPVNLQATDYRAARGGSWHDDAWFLRSACREGYPPGTANRYVGFRVCLASAVPGSPGEGSAWSAAVCREQVKGISPALSSEVPTVCLCPRAF